MYFFQYTPSAHSDGLSMVSSPAPPLGIPLRLCIIFIFENRNNEFFLNNICFCVCGYLLLHNTLIYNIFRESPQPKIQRGKSAYARIKQLSLKGRNKEVKPFKRRIFKLTEIILFLGWEKSKIEFEIPNETELQNTVKWLQRFILSYCRPPMCSIVRGTKAVKTKKNVKIIAAAHTEIDVTIKGRLQ